MYKGTLLLGIPLLILENSKRKQPESFAINICLLFPDASVSLDRVTSVKQMGALVTRPCLELIFVLPGGIWLAGSFLF